MKGRHVSKSCFSKKECGVTVDNQSCSRYHHPLLHDAFKEGKSTSVSRFKNPSSFYACQRVLLVISKLYSNGHPLTTLWDPGSDLTMITLAAAERLGLRGKDFFLTVTGIGNKTRTVNSKEYNIPLTDSEGKTWNIVAYGISEISEAICRVDVSQVRM